MFPKGHKRYGNIHMNQSGGSVITVILVDTRMKKTISKESHIDKTISNWKKGRGKIINYFISWHGMAFNWRMSRLDTDNL